MEPPVTRISSKLTICFTLPYSQRKITGIGRFVDDLARKLQNAHIESMTLAPWTSGATSEEASLRLRGTFLLNFQLGVLTAVRLFRLRRKFQILHAQHAQIQSLAACMTARILGKPSVITLHGQVADPADVDDSLRTSDLLAAQSHVRILGPVSESLPNILGAADVFVLPSLHEGMPLGLLEGMATGLPALVSDIEVNRMIVEGSGCGWTFRSGDALELR